MSTMTERVILSRTYYTYETRDGVDFPVQHVMTNRELARMVGGKTPARMNDLRGRRKSFDVAAPGTGRISYVITKVDESGVWGRMIENTVRELTAADVY